MKRLVTKRMVAAGMALAVASCGSTSQQGSRNSSVGFADGKTLIFEKLQDGNGFEFKVCKNETCVNAFNRASQPAVFTSAGEKTFYIENKGALKETGTVILVTLVAAATGWAIVKVGGKDGKGISSSLLGKLRLSKPANDLSKQIATLTKELPNAERRMTKNTANLSEVMSKIERILLKDEYATIPQRLVSKRDEFAAIKRDLDVKIPELKESLVHLNREVNFQEYKATAETRLAQLNASTAKMKEFIEVGSKDKAIDGDSVAILNEIKLVETEIAGNHKEYLRIASELETLYDTMAKIPEVASLKLASESVTQSNRLWTRIVSTPAKVWGAIVGVAASISFISISDFAKTDKAIASIWDAAFDSEDPTHLVEVPEGVSLEDVLKGFSSALGEGLEPNPAAVQ